MVYKLLSDRQGQILGHLCAGKTVQETADALATSVNNVNGQRSNIRTRLGGRSFDEICHLADLGVEPEPTVSAATTRRHPSVRSGLEPPGAKFTALSIHENQAPGVHRLPGAAGEQFGDG